MSNDLRTRAIVLRRTNYGESDRILNMLTPEGKIAVLARGVRKEKSRLAGGIELFSQADIVVHRGRSSLATLTSARMLCFYHNILTDLSRLELASNFLKRLDRAAEQSDNPEYFDLLEQSLAGLNQGLSPELILTWFSFNLARASGEQINFLCDTAGVDLKPDQRYFWDTSEAALRLEPQGVIGPQEIKLARLLLSSKLATVSRVNGVEKLIFPLSAIARSLS